jgi:hypothetical protein
MWLEMENEMGFDEKASWLRDDVCIVLDVGFDYQHI